MLGFLWWIVMLFVFVNWKVKQSVTSCSTICKDGKEIKAINSHPDIFKRTFTGHIIKQQEG